jgi:hypothetical protein
VAITVTVAASNPIGAVPHPMVHGQTSKASPLQPNPISDRGRQISFPSTGDSLSKLRGRGSGTMEWGHRGQDKIGAKEAATELGSAPEEQILNCEFEF